MRILDLFCGVGGASVGYARASFEVVGVDLSPQPDYPFEFHQVDAVEVAHGLATGGPWTGRFDAIHASPPCAAYTSIVKGTNGGKGNHPRLYEPISEALRRVGLPYVIENPASRPDIVLCGEMFGLGVLRHRKFELGGWSMPQPPHKPHRGRVRGYNHGIYYDGPYVAVYGKGGDKAKLPEAQAAMDIHWTQSLPSIVQAIPPAYTEYVGSELIKFLEA